MVLPPLPNSRLMVMTRWVMGAAASGWKNAKDFAILFLNWAYRATAIRQEAVSVMVWTHIRPVTPLRASSRKEKPQKITPSRRTASSR